MAPAKTMATQLVALLVSVSVVGASPVHPNGHFVWGLGRVAPTTLATSRTGPISATVTVTVTETVTTSASETTISNQRLSGILGLPWFKVSAAPVAATVVSIHTLRLRGRETSNSCVVKLWDRTDMVMY